jgi:hypothetical protein
MRRWILNIHLYGGLITCWYLLIYGVSSLAFNHPWIVPPLPSGTTTWSRPVQPPPLADDVALAQAVRDELGLFGWPLPWAMKRGSDGALTFDMQRPGKQYRIRVDGAAAHVEERSTGLRSVIRGLHGMSGGVPGSRWMAPWTAYTEITTWIVVFSAASGVWLWWSRLRNRRAGMMLLALSASLSLGLMVYVFRAG